MTQVSFPLSIVVIAYNEEQYLPRNLLSLSQQTVQDFEVIMVDSDSTDGTAAVADGFVDKLPALRYLKLSQAQGPGFARNRGAEIAVGKRLLFLDADTILPADFIDRTTEQSARLEADVATCPLKSTESSISARLGAAFLNGSMRLLRPVYSCAYGACMFSTRQAHDAVGGFDENIGICEDCHYVKKSRKLGFRFRILSPFFQTSDRRLQSQGKVRLMGKYISCHLRRMITGREIMKEDIDYPYGQF